MYSNLLGIPWQDKTFDVRRANARKRDAALIRFGVFRGQEGNELSSISLPSIQSLSLSSWNYHDGACSSPLHTPASPWRDSNSLVNCKIGDRSVKLNTTEHAKLNKSIWTRVFKSEEQASHNSGSFMLPKFCKVFEYRHFRLPRPGVLKIAWEHFIFGSPVPEELKNGTKPVFS